MTDVAKSKHSGELAKLEKILKELIAEDLKMCQEAYHDHNGYKQELQDLSTNFYGLWSPQEERTIAYFTAEIGSRLRRLNDHLKEKGTWDG